MSEEEQAQQAEAASAETSEAGSDFGALLKKEFKPKTSQRESAIEQAVHTLAEQALQHTNLVSDDSVQTIEAMISEIDSKLTSQVNLILHHADFQKLEGSWRGLAHLCNNTETDETLKIRVMNVSKDDLAKMFKKFKGVKWDQSPLFKKIYRDEYSMLGGEPYGCLVGDYHFTHRPKDCAVLAGIAEIAAASHAPFISAADPNLLQYDSWQELPDTVDLTKIFSDAEYATWRSLRESADSRYIGLTMPRFLARLPYGPETEEVEEFDFREEVDGTDHGKYLWANSAYAMAVNINQAFKEDGWAVRIRGIESGGAVGGMPIHTFKTDDGGTDMKCPTEVAIDDRREAELAKNGFMPVLHRKNSDEAAFIGAQSLQKPDVFEDADATANANLSARLPYMFAISRFAHFLKVIVREKIGSFKEKDDVQNWLSGWISQYVDESPLATEEDKAKRPLSAAEVLVEEDPENPGYYSARFSLRPHYQLEGLDVSLSLVSKLPSVKQ